MIPSLTSCSEAIPEFVKIVPKSYQQMGLLVYEEGVDTFVQNCPSDEWQRCGVTL
jgi:hypothetical protein